MEALIVDGLFEEFNHKGQKRYKMRVSRPKRIKSRFFEEGVDMGMFVGSG